MKIERENPQKILYKTSYADTQFSEMIIKAPRTNKKIQLDLQQLYKRKIKLPERKKADLMDLVKKKHIPLCYADFYVHLCVIQISII